MRKQPGDGDVLIVRHKGVLRPRASDALLPDRSLGEVPQTVWGAMATGESPITLQKGV